MKKYNILAIATILLGAICSCQTEGSDQGKDKYAVDYPLTFGASVNNIDNLFVTKSSELVSDDGSITLPLSCVVSEGIGDILPAAAASPVTKGTQVNTTDDTDTLSKYVSVIGESFNVAAFDNDGARFIPDGGSAQFDVVTYNSTTSEWSTGSSAYIWKGQGEKTFYAYANLPTTETDVVEAGVVCTDNSAETLTYTTVPTDPTKQKDILLGYYKGKGKYDAEKIKGGIADITFYHPMTAVKFVDNMSGASFSIKSISLSNVYKSGVAKITPASMEETDPDSKVVWTPGSEMQTVTLGNGTDALAVDEETKVIGGADGVFLLIPQDLTSEAVDVSVILEINGAMTSLSSTISTGRWKAGYTNTYTLGYDASIYEFKLTDISQWTQTFENTTEELSESIAITSDLIDEDITPVDWTIKSYKIGTADAVEVNGTSFTAGGLTVSKDGSNLNVTALARTADDKGSNAYWTNRDSRIEDLEWSPEDWTDKGVIDLSRYSFQSDVTDNVMCTANCYIIRHAGTYKLPLVYGNAIIRSRSNESSYYPEYTTGEANRLDRFVNSAGNGIQSPFIENAEGCGGPDLKCAVVWQDKAKVVKNLQIVNGGAVGTPGSYTEDDVRYLQFTISQDDIRQNNALICIYKDKEGGRAGQYDPGEAIWSWHIWTTNNPVLLYGENLIRNKANEPYKLFRISQIGWIDSENYPGSDQMAITLEQSESGKTIDVIVNQPDVFYVGSGCWYQWGRKDPMCTTDFPAEGTYTVNGGSGSTLANAISDPGTFYVGNLKNWCNTTYDNLWTGGFCHEGLFEQNNLAMVKTVYDPSPVGFKMPASNVFTGFTTTGGNASSISQFNVYGEYSQGWHFYTSPSKDQTVFFPASGNRDYRNGSINDVCSCGYYWTAIPASTNNGYLLHFNSERVNPVYSSFRANGFSVRPVLEPID